MNTSSLRGYALAAAATACATLAALALLPYADLTNIAMLFLLAVIAVAFKLGRGPAIAAALFNIAAFDFFCVPPRFSFAVADVQYLVTFAVMLAVGLVIAHLASSLRREAETAAGRERRALDLYELARVLSGALTEEQVADAASRFLAQGFGARAALLVRNRGGELWTPEIAGLPALKQIDRIVAQSVFEHREDNAPWKIATGLMYLPLKAPLRTRGVLIVEPPEPGVFEHPEQGRQLETFAVLIAIALERVHFVTVAREATVQMEGERLRNSVLAALSHDLRTPLTTVLGSAESLLLDAASMNAEQIAAIDAIRDQTRRTCELVENILDMARLESGGVRLSKDWQSLEEIVGAAIKSRASALRRHVINVVSPPDLPLVECDAVLIERVLVNLLENASKYTPPGSVVRISMRTAGDCALIDVQDNGPGVVPGTEEAVFEKFARGRVQPGVPGLGLGLALGRAIVEAHGGRIWVETASGGGAQFAFTLPLGTPPMVEPEAADAR